MLLAWTIIVLLILPPELAPNADLALNPEIDNSLGMELKATPPLTHEQQIERLQELCSSLQKALDVSEEQRRILRDMASTASELAEALEGQPPERPARASRKKR